MTYTLGIGTRSRGITLWRRKEIVVERIIDLKRSKRGRMLRSIVKSSSHITKILPSEY
jgi:hypothetical protein